MSQGLVDQTIIQQTVMTVRTTLKVICQLPDSVQAGLYRLNCPLVLLFLLYYLLDHLIIVSAYHKEMSLHYGIVFNGGILIYK